MSNSKFSINKNTTLSNIVLIMVAKFSNELSVRSQKKNIYFKRMSPSLKKAPITMEMPCLLWKTTHLRKLRNKKRKKKKLTVFM